MYTQYTYIYTVYIPNTPLYTLYTPSIHTIYTPYTHQLIDRAELLRGLRSAGNGVADVRLALIDAACPVQGEEGVVGREELALGDDPASLALYMDANGMVCTVCCTVWCTVWCGVYCGVYCVVCTVRVADAS